MKAALQSKTIWFALGKLLFGVVGLMTGWMESTMAMTLIGLGVADIGLRNSTTAPISGVMPR